MAYVPTTWVDDADPPVSAANLQHMEAGIQTADATAAAAIPKATVTTKGDLLVATGSGVVARVGVGTDGQAVVADSTQASGVKWAVTNPDLVHLQYQQPSGTHGGSVVAATWTNYPMNTEVADAGNHCSLAANLFTLDAGTYEISAVASIYGNNASVKTRLRNTTDGTTLVVGMSSYGSLSSGNSGLGGRLFGRFTVAAGKALALQYWSTNAEATDGLGVAGTTGEIEIYGEVQLRKIA